MQRPEMQRRSTVPAHYLQTSPVRGQLEPYEGAGGTRTGWRYLQCTDTPNELKVLLPPRTALLYGHLLHAEAVELGKDKAASWDRVLRIRHLKDRMIRKCQRLARVAPPKQLVTFRTVHAPADFRLKELEKWIGEDEEVQTFTADPAPQPTISSVGDSSKGKSPCNCNQCRRRNAQTRSATLSPKSQRSSYGRPKSSGSTARRSSAMVNIMEGPSSQPFPTMSAADSAPPPMPEPMVMPEPLPNPYSGPTSMEDTPLIPPIDLSGIAARVDSVDDSPRPSFNQDDHDRPPRHTLPRRRSSLKQRDGTGRSSNGSTKSVAWAINATDGDWVGRMSAYEKTITELEASGNEIEEMRASYRAQIDEIRDLREDVCDALNRLQIDMDRLRRGEQSMRALEERVRVRYEALEGKGERYKSTVHAMIGETKQIMQLSERIPAN